MNTVVEKAKKEADKRSLELKKELDLSERGVARSWDKVHEKDRN